MNCVMMHVVWHRTIGKGGCATHSRLLFWRSFMEEKLREYAKLLIEVGLNVQKGQTVVIRCPV